MVQKYKWTILFILLTPVLIFVSFFLLLNYGWIEPSILLFPFTAVQFIRITGMNSAFMIASLIQYPLYGLLIDSFDKIKNIKLLLVIIHIILAIASYLFIPENFK